MAARRQLDACAGFVIAEPLRDQGHRAGSFWPLRLPFPKELECPPGSDISIPLYTGTVHWPGDPEPILERLLDMDQGEEANVTFLKMTAHTGTHIDAPRHFLAEGAALDTFPLDTAIGPARVIEIQADALRIGPEHLSQPPH